MSKANGNTPAMRVEIYDQSYNLRGCDPEHINKIAEYVDAKMRAVAKQTSTVDSLRVAVLAALNIADEYFTLQRQSDAGEVSRVKNYHERAQHLSGMLDEVLNEGRKAG